MNVYKKIYITSIIFIWAINVITIIFSFLLSLYSVLSVFDLFKVRGLFRISNGMGAFLYLLPNFIQLIPVTVLLLIDILSKTIIKTKCLFNPIILILLYICPLIAGVLSVFNIQYVIFENKIIYLIFVTIQISINIIFIIITTKSIIKSVINE